MFTDEVPVEDDRTCEPSGKDIDAWGSSDDMLCDGLACTGWKLPCYSK